MAIINKLIKFKYTIFVNEENVIKKVIINMPALQLHCSLNKHSYVHTIEELF